MPKLLHPWVIGPAVVVLLGLVAFLLLRSKKQRPTFQDVLEGKIALAASDRDAVQRLLTEARLPPSALTLLDPGARPGAPGVVIEGQRVVGLGLSAGALKSTAALAPLTELRWLGIPNNEIEDLSGLGAQSKPQLRHLNLWANRITSTAAFGALPELRWLALGSNRIQKIEGLSGHPHLETLSLGENQLTSVEGIRDLPALKYLYLEKNQLEDLDGLEGLPELVELRLSGNRLTDLDALRRFPALRVAWVEDNRITALPAEKLSIFDLRLAGNPVTEQGPPITPEAREEARPTPVEALPTGSSREGKHGSCWTKSTSDMFNEFIRLSCKGDIARFEGILQEKLYRRHILHTSPLVTTHVKAKGSFTLSVTRGRVRVYLQQGARYLAATASAGVPVALEGDLLDFGGKTYGVVLEALDGSAEGIAFSFESFK